MQLPIPFLIVYEIGNGYHCGCCRSTSTSTDIRKFDSIEAAVEYARSVGTDEDDDRKVTEIYQLRDKEPVYEA